jgi:hypothetical protein
LLPVLMVRGDFADLLSSDSADTLALTDPIGIR